jgi:hypothetical protein
MNRRELLGNGLLTGIALAIGKYVSITTLPAKETGVNVNDNKPKKAKKIKSESYTYDYFDS